MNKQPAKVLEPAELRLVFKHVQNTRHPTRNRAMVLLSFKAGLRACEIAGLSWPMVLTSAGKLGPTVNVSRHIAKQGRAGRIPMHAELIITLATLHAEAGFIREGPVICSERQRHMTARSVVNWFRDTKPSHLSQSVTVRHLCGSDLSSPTSHTFRRCDDCDAD